MKTKKVKSENISSIIDESINKGEYIRALDLIRRFKINRYTITKSRLKRQYKLKEEQLLMLAFSEVKNPYYSSASTMKLYLIAQAELVFNLKIEVNETKRYN